MWGRSRYDFEEAENRVCNSLSRLIHTLQHFPSKRSRLDTTSLWNLVDDIESFNPDRKPRSMHFTQTTERKTYSKNCLNLRISEGNENYTPRSYKKSQTFKHYKSGDKSCGDFSPSVKKSNKSKENGFQKPTLINSPNKRESPKNTRTNNFEIKKVNKTVNNNEIRKNNPDISNVRRNCLPRGKEHKSDNIISQNKQKVNSMKYPIKNLQLYKSNNCKGKGLYQHTPQKPKVGTFGSRPGVLNRKQIPNFKCKSHQCTPKSNETLQKIIFENSQSSLDRNSVVKKLTNYWNSLLNNETDQCSSSVESFQNVESLGGSVKTETSSERSGSTLRSRHMSESNLNIMKRVDDLGSKKAFDVLQNPEMKTLISTKKIMVDPFPGKCSLKTINEENKGQGALKENMNQKDLNQSPIISMKDFIEELQKIIDTLTSIPNSKILSDKILLQTFPQKISYIFVASLMFNSQNAMLLEKLAAYADKMIEEIIKSKPENSNAPSEKASVENELKDDVLVDHILSALNNNLEIETDYVFKGKGKIEDKPSPNQEKPVTINKYKNHGSVRTTNELVVNDYKSFDSRNYQLIRGISSNKVKNALKLYMIWREMTWANQSYRRNSYYDTPFQSFTIIYEEDIFVDEESCCDNDFYQYESELKHETSTNLYRSAVTAIESCIDTITNVLEDYLPDSPEALISMIYQFLVSFLIWWVIVKEIFVE